MTNYRRNILPGGSYFFTVNLAERRRSLLTDNIASPRTAFRYVRGRHLFTVEAIVILPDHLHAIWTLPEGDADYSLRWRLIKSSFSRALPNRERVSASRLGKGERGIWQRRKLRQNLSNLFDRVSTGVHTDVIADEAFSLFLNTYLFLGEVLHLGTPSNMEVSP